MSFLGDFNPIKVATKIFGGKSDIIPNIITLGGYGLTKQSLSLAAKEGSRALKGLTAIHAAAPPAITPGGGSSPGFNYYYNQPPQYGMPGPGYFDPSPLSYPPSEPFYGGASWGSSTTYPTSFNPSPVIYSAPPATRSWEDLVLPLVPFFL